MVILNKKGFTNVNQIYAISIMLGYLVRWMGGHIDIRAREALRTWS